MCFADTLDTLNLSDQAFLRSAGHDFPAHRLELRSNDDGLTWALLTPEHHSKAVAVLPKVTICRIDPCIMIMLEDRHARRQFRSFPNMEEAVAGIQLMSDHLLLAAAGQHDREQALQ